MHGVAQLEQEAALERRQRKQPAKGRQTQSLFRPSTRHVAPGGGFVDVGCAVGSAGPDEVTVRFGAVSCGGFIKVSADVSKVREPREVVIQPNLTAWLRAYPLDKFPIVLGIFKKRRQKFAQEFGLTHDVLQHAFISMFVAKFRSLGEAAIQAGNSEVIIRKHYLDLKDAAEAEKFWRIMPKHAAASITPGPVAALPVPA